jgi:DNA-binding transcriptional regulator GbsR (MarR family)
MSFDEYILKGNICLQCSHALYLFSSSEKIERAIDTNKGMIDKLKRDIPTNQDDRRRYFMKIRILTDRISMLEQEKNVIRDSIAGLKQRRHEILHNS